MAENGLQTFSVHGDDPRFQPTLDAIESEAATIATVTVEETDPETNARRYLSALMSTPNVPAPRADIVDFLVIGTETVALTGTKAVKFSQYYRGIPVYGALVTVELDSDNSLLAVHTALGEPLGVDPVATVSPAEALEAIGESGSTEPPKLYYYFDAQANPTCWRLVYIAKDVTNAAGSEASLHAPDLADYVVDAHAGTLVARLPRTQSVAWAPAEVIATDGLGRSRDIVVERDEAGNERLFDAARNVRTHDFHYQNVRRHSDLLPGEFVTNPPTPWSDAAVSAHANAVDVADYLLTVLRRNGLDNQGGPFISSINCTYSTFDEPGNRVWRNAAWIGTQMVYGQRLVDGQLRSYAIASDVVAHEITHGLTESTARLEYRTETGAMNESYSDIFGILISNRGIPDVADWNWEMGEDLDLTGIPLRDISDPTRYGQPDHMSNFRKLAFDEIPAPDNDNGWVHLNSGIHNKAAYNLLTARDSDGVPILSTTEVAALFYVTLSQYLSRTSQFVDSRRGVLLASRTLARSETAESRQRKLDAVATAFDAVGITN